MSRLGSSLPVCCATRWMNSVHCCRFLRYNARPFEHRVFKKTYVALDFRGAVVVLKMCRLDFSCLLCPDKEGQYSDLSILHRVFHTPESAGVLVPCWATEILSLQRRRSPPILKDNVRRLRLALVWSNLDSR